MDDRLFIDTARATIERAQLKSTARFVQHGDTSVLLHSIAVAHRSLRLARFLRRTLRLTFHERALIRGALLHDYFLYDWHDGHPDRRIHGFTHPSIALKNALADYDLNPIERDIIKKHMFPLTPIPPATRESLLVCLVDKVCSVYETFSKDAYPALKRELRLSGIGPLRMA